MFNSDCVIQVMQGLGYTEQADCLATPELANTYQLGQLFGIALILVLSGIGLYAMTYNQSVKNYFNKS